MLVLKGDNKQINIVSYFLSCIMLCYVMLCFMEVDLGEILENFIRFDYSIIVKCTDNNNDNNNDNDNDSVSFFVVLKHIRALFDYFVNFNKSIDRSIGQSVNRLIRLRLLRKQKLNRF